MGIENNILGAIVFFNPNELAFDNLKRLCLCDYIKKVVVFDNSNVSNKDRIYNISNQIIYISYQKNMGIACALSEIMEYSVSNGFEYTLTLDQDSKFPYEKMGNICQLLKKYNNGQFGIISLNYNNKYKGNTELIIVKNIITSGNFIVNKNYMKISGFKKELFIDYVDFDLCHQFYKNNIKIAVLRDYSIEQTIGNPVYIKILFLKIKLLNHSPIRYYYRYRNEFFCYKNDKQYYLKNHFKEKIAFYLMILFEKNKWNKIKMVKKGKKDAKQNKFGEYEE